MPRWDIIGLRPRWGSNLLFRLQFLDPQEYEDDAVFRSYIDDE